MCPRCCIGKLRKKLLRQEGIYRTYLDLQINLTLSLAELEAQDFLVKLVRNIDPKDPIDSITFSRYPLQYRIYIFIAAIFRENTHSLTSAFDAFISKANQ